MKEFHLALAEAQHNKLQFAQLCRDSWHEMEYESVGYFESAMFIKKYYDLDWNALQVARFGKFIKSGKYLEQLKLYV